MFFFIGGIQPKTILVEKQARSCSACGHIELSLKRADHYLSLFFIPLFPVKRGIPFLLCENCHTVFDERGTRLDRAPEGKKKKCPHCGYSMNQDYRFCPYCGNPV